MSFDGAFALLFLITTNWPCVFLRPLVGQGEERFLLGLIWLFFLPGIGRFFRE
jgi:hypothetical protein